MTRQFILAADLRIWTIISSEKLHLDAVDLSYKRILLEWKKIISSFNTSNEIWFSCQPQHHALLTAEFLIPSSNFLLIHLQIKLFITIFDGVTLSHTWFFWKEKHQRSGASINFCCCLQGPHDYPSLTWADSSFRQTDWIFLIVYFSEHSNVVRML